MDGGNGDKYTDGHSTGLIDVVLYREWGCSSPLPEKSLVDNDNKKKT